MADFGMITTKPPDPEYPPGITPGRGRDKPLTVAELRGEITDGPTRSTFEPEEIREALTDPPFKIRSAADDYARKLGNAKPTEDRPHPASKTNDPIAIQLPNGQWIGNLDIHKPSHTLGMFNEPDRVSYLAIRYETPTSPTSIPWASRPTRFVLSVNVYGQNVYIQPEKGSQPDETPKFAVEIHDYVLPSDPAEIPQPILDVPNYEDRVSHGNICEMFLTLNRDNLVTHNLFTVVTHPIAQYQQQVELFESVFDQQEEFTVRILIRDEYRNTQGTLSAIISNFEDDRLDGDLWMRYLPPEKRSWTKKQIPQKGQVIPIEERPENMYFRKPAVWPDYHSYAMSHWMAEQEAEEYTQWAVKEFEKADGHYAKFLKIPGGGITKYWATFQFDTESRQLLKLNEGQKFKFKLVDEDGDTTPSDYFAAEITSHSKIGRGSQVCCHINRLRQLPAVDATPEELQHTHKLIRYEIQVPDVVKGDNVSSDEIRAVLKKTKKYKVVEIALQTSDKTHRQRQYAQTMFYKGTHIERSPEGGKVWVETEGVQKIKDIISGKRTKPIEYVNLSEGCDDLLLNLDDDDAHYQLTNCLKRSPDGFVLIQGAAGSGKTMRLATWVAAKIIAHYGKLNLMGIHFDPDDPTPLGELVCADSNAACDAFIHRFLKAQEILDVGSEALRVLPFVARALTDSAEKQAILEIANGKKRHVGGTLSEKDQEAYEKLGLLVSDREMEEGWERIEKKKALSRTLYGRGGKSNTHNDHTSNDESNDNESDAGKSNASLTSDDPRLEDEEARILPDGTLEVEDNGPEMLHAYTRIIKAHNDSTAPGSGIVSDKRMQIITSSVGYKGLVVAGLIPGVKCRYTDKERFKDFRILYTKYYRGQLDDDSDGMVTFRDEIKALMEYTIERLDVLVVTAGACCSDLYSKHFKAKGILIDEATMMGVANFITIMNCYPNVGHVIMIGDRFQGKPIGNGPPNPDHGFTMLQTESVFRNCLDRQWPYCNLLIQRRSAAKVYDIANKIFYRGEVVDGKQVKDPELIKASRLFCDFVEHALPATKEVNRKFPGHKKCPYVQVSPPGTVGKLSDSHSIYNEVNAAVGMNLIVRMMEFSKGVVQPGDWRIITPYLDQKEIYEKAIDEYILQYPTTDMAAWEANKQKWSALTVHTVDSFEGEDHKYIIADNVVTDHIGFLADEGRTCVTHTRSKAGYILIALADDIIKNDVIKLQEMRGKGIKYNRMSIQSRVYRTFQEFGRLRSLDNDHPMLSHPYVQSLPNADDFGQDSYGDGQGNADSWGDQDNDGQHSNDGQNNAGCGGQDDKGQNNNESQNCAGAWDQGNFGDNSVNDWAVVNDFSGSFDTFKSLTPKRFKFTTSIHSSQDVKNSAAEEGSQSVAEPSRKSKQTKNKSGEGGTGTSTIEVFAQSIKDTKSRSMTTRSMGSVKSSNTSVASKHRIGGTGGNDNHSGIVGVELGGKSDVPETTGEGNGSNGDDGWIMNDEAVNNAEVITGSQTIW